MLFEPGPLPILAGPLAAGDLVIEDPGFTPLVLDALQDLPGEEAAMDDLLAALGDEVFDDPGVVIDAALGDADSELATHTQASYVGDTAQIQLDSVSGSEMLSNAISETPKEAWQPVPGPDAFGNPNAPVTGPNPLTNTLSNASNPGAPLVDVLGPLRQFYLVPADVGIGPHLEPGETLMLNIRAEPQPGGGGTSGNLVIQGTFVRVDAGSERQLTLGTTDALGFLTATLPMDDSWTGDWSVRLFTTSAGGENFSDQQYFQVGVPAPPPTGGGGDGGSGGGGGGGGPATFITVSLINVGDSSNPDEVPDNSQFSVNDEWQLEVIGAPNAPVVLSAIKDGQQLPPAQIGVTEPDGVFQLDGTMTSADVGAWQETYFVGGVQWNGELDYTVQ